MRSSAISISRKDVSTGPRVCLCPSGINAPHNLACNKSICEVISTMRPSRLVRIRFIKSSLRAPKTISAIDPSRAHLPSKSSWRHSSHFKRMINTSTRTTFSRLQLPIASLQTSTFQVSNRTVGVSMSFPKKSDVKNHLSRRIRKNILPFRPVTGPNLTGYLGRKQNPSSTQISGIASLHSENLVAVPVIRKLPA